ncbi:uncharacterized protein LOC110734745 [Chenopodium quinoa]|uniref:uncharacterized protein LOC110734745 n=1 Tax=Chenopodium quinoa TaxID=63459 RepID=UPI000B76EA57|nr:uncharacterized protein LOC110734745 [Chenopodium quinoa]
MAKSFTLALPPPQSQNLNQILKSQLNKKPTIISSSSSSSSYSWTRISSLIFRNTNCINITNNNVNYYVHYRRFSSIFASPVSSISYCYFPLYSNCDSLRFSSLSLLPLRRSCLSSLRFSIMSQNDEHGAPISQDSFKTVRCIIKGRVQGVFYRNWTIENANQLGLKGWVRNRRDGSVEALFSGKAEVVDEMVQRCRRGPPDAMVTALNVDPSNEDPGSGFERKPTV